MKNTLKKRLALGRPVSFSPSEAELVRTAVRNAMAVTLERPEAEIGDDTLVFDDLGLDSIDVFDILDQLAEAFDVPVELEQLPGGLIRGGQGLTFSAFADGIIAYFEQEPPQAPPT
ncbi:MAG: acyl carrier protein [bacterium]